MADLISLLKNVSGVYSDGARDRLPPGSVWEMTDYIPNILQAGVRMRGAWIFQSTDAFATAPAGMIYAPFGAGSRLLTVEGTNLRSIPLSAPGVSVLLGTVPATKQNPVFHRTRAIIPAADGVTSTKFVTFDGITFTLTDAPVSAPKGRLATVWKDRLILAAPNGQEQEVYFSKPGDPTIAWDVISNVSTSLPLTGLAAQRTQILCFHDSSIERLRGTTPPDTALSDQTGDLLLDNLFDKAGCFDPRSIAYWNDNVVFADERGVFVTDGAVVRNMTKQGGIINLWRSTFERGGGQPLSIAGTVHQDYYICSVRNTGVAPVTFVIDLNGRRAFTVANVDSNAFAYSIGTAEKLYGTDAASKRVTDLSPIFDPDPTIFQVDGNGAAVLPVIATAWSGLTKEPGFKRVQEVHLSYVADRDDAANTLSLSYIGTPNGADTLLDYYGPQKTYKRRKLSCGRRIEGVAVRLVQLQQTRDTRLYEISLRAYAEEAARLETA